MNQQVEGSFLLLAVVALNALFVYWSIVSLGFAAVAAPLWWVLGWVISYYVTDAAARWMRKADSKPA